MSIHEDWKDPEQRKPGMSTTVKVLLLLGGIGGICSLLCCGGAFILVNRAQQILEDAGINFKDIVTVEPEAIRERTQKIAKLEIPPGFEPKQAVDMVIMKYAIYTKGANADSSLVLMEFAKEFMGEEEEQQEEMLEAFQKRQTEGGNLSADVEVQSSETREFTIRGETANFEFNKATNKKTGAKVRQVVGSFATKNGVAMLVFVVPEDEYDDAVAVKLIESIGDPETPEPAVPAEAEDPSQPNDAAAVEQTPTEETKVPE